MNTHPRIKLVVTLNMSDDDNDNGIPSNHKLPLFICEGHTEINRNEVINNSNHMECEEMTFKSREIELVDVSQIRWTIQ